MFAVLREAPDSGYVALDSGFHKYILWFNTYLKNFSGTVKIHSIDTGFHQIFLDASLKGLGAFYEGAVCATPLLSCLVNVLSIVHFEAVNIMVALKL